MELSVELTMVGRITVAALLGAIVGFQRERANRSAGLRTMILICFGSALFTVISVHAFGASVDPARVAANIVTGIGFLGAGAIMHPTHGVVAGLTTAAAIWAMAAVGMAVGLGLFWLAIIGTIIVFIVLILPNPIR